MSSLVCITFSSLCAKVRGPRPISVLASKKYNTKAKVQAVLAKFSVIQQSNFGSCCRRVGTTRVLNNSFLSLRAEVASILTQNPSRCSAKNFSPSQRAMPAHPKRFAFSAWEMFTPGRVVAWVVAWVVLLLEKDVIAADRT